MGEAAEASVQQLEWALDPSTGATMTGFLPTHHPEICPGFQTLLPAMLIFPGGGYHFICFEKEGKRFAEWLCSVGIAGFVVSYSTQPARHPTQLGEGLRALRRVRELAGELGLDPRRLGVMGSSAGGHLAGLILTASEAEIAAVMGGDVPADPAPTVGILCYPVVTLDFADSCAHKGSRANLIGELASEDPDVCRRLSLQTRVSERMPPTLVWHTWDDKTVPVENAYILGAALGRAGVQHELHVYQHDGVCHGAGLTGDGPEALPWTGAVLRWLREQNFC